VRDCDDKPLPNPRHVAFEEGSLAQHQSECQFPSEDELEKLLAKATQIAIDKNKGLAVYKFRMIAHELANELTDWLQAKLSPGEHHIGGVNDTKEVKK